MRLILGRGLVKLLPLAQRTKTLTVRRTFEQRSGRHKERNFPGSTKHTDIHVTDSKVPALRQLLTQASLFSWRKRVSHTEKKGAVRDSSHYSPTLVK